ncbi:hypothetical protein BH10PSE1_BH10PSE1_03200 [soil metagenome]
MFNKTNTPRPAPAPIPPLPNLPSQASRPMSAPTPAPSPVSSSRGLSTLSSDLQFEGVVSGAGDLQVDGSIKGDVRVGRLIVGETGAIEGNVAADYLEIRGRIVGAVTGKQVKLISTAYVDGDITAKQLASDVGAYFQGRVLQSRAATPAAQPAPVRPVPSAFDAPPIPAAEPAPQVIERKSVYFLPPLYGEGRPLLRQGWGVPAKTAVGSGAHSPTRPRRLVVPPHKGKGEAYSTVEPRVSPTRWARAAPMKASRSPSRTPAVSEVSTSVRRSLTI